MRELLQATVKTGSASVIMILFGTLKTKILAVVVGPGGTGLFSLLDQATLVTLMLASLSSGAAIVQGLAQRTGEERARYMRTIFALLLATGGLAAGGLVLFAGVVARWLLPSATGPDVLLVRSLAVPMCLMLMLNVLTSILSANYAVGRMALVSVAVAGVGLALAYPAALIARAGHPIAYVAMVSISQAVGVLVALGFAVRAGWLAPLLQSRRLEVNREAARHFLSFSGVTVLLGLVGSGTILALRVVVTGAQGLFGVGILDAAWRLSMTYVSLVLSAFGAYYLPKLSATREPHERRLLMNRVSRLSIVLIVPLVIGMILGKPLIINLLYSASYWPAVEILRWMLIGDYFKVAAWVLAMPALADADMKVYFWTETLWHLGLLGGSALIVERYQNLQGIGLAFLLANVVYVTFYLGYTRRRHGFRLDRALVLPWAAGLALILGASWLNWSNQTVNWLLAGPSLALACLISWLTLEPAERASVVQFLPPLRFAGRHAE